MIRTYSEMIKLPTFEERFEYLRLNGQVCEDTFGFDRYLNQRFYTSDQWRRIRDKVIFRDDGLDLAMEGHTIYGKIIIHHINPIRKEDVLGRSDYLLNPDYLVCVSENTHRAIHYGDINQIPKDFVERSKNDTCPWRH